MATANYVELFQASVHKDFCDTLAQRLLWVYKASHILTHGANPDNCRIPLFANIRFPQRDCLKWAPGKIRLLDKYSSAASAKQTFEEECIEDKVLGELREDAAKNAKKSEKA